MHKSKPETVSHRRVTHFPEAPQRNSEARKTLDGHKAMAELNNTNTLTLDVEGQKLVLEKEDLLIETIQTE